MENTWVASLSPDELEAKGKDIAYDVPDMFFAIWLKEVDLLLAQTGTLESHTGLDDWDWFEAYQQDRTPEEALSRYLGEQSERVINAFNELLNA